MLSDTLPHDRAMAIKAFGDGALRVLVNVAVATEGFDLPEASCVVITRPTIITTTLLRFGQLWPEIASRKARQQGCHGRGQVAMKRCSRSLSCEASL